MFTVGFIKISMMDHNNQGLEFQASDNTNATSNVGPGGMAPQGMETYQPIPKQETAKPKLENQKKSKFNIAQFLMAKGASAQSVQSIQEQKTVPGWTNNLTMAYKYDNSSVDATPDDIMNSLGDEKARIKKYKKASKK